MKKITRLTALFLSLVMIFALAACGGGTGGSGASADPYNLDYTSEELQPMSEERASKDTLLEAKEYFIGGLQSSPAEFSKMTYKDMAEHIGTDASEFQYFDSYKQYRYTWYVEGNEGPCLTAAFDANKNLYAVTASIS